MYVYLYTSIYGSGKPDICMFFFINFYALCFLCFDSRFDTSQLRAIRMSLTGRGVTLIQGPPGTGKTKTILGILSVLLTTQDGTTTRCL